MPHDMSGRSIDRGDIVACHYLEDKLCFGIVAEVNYSTGAIVVQTIAITRNPLMEERKFLFPANQVIIVPKERFNPNIEEHKLILQEKKQLRYR